MEDKKIQLSKAIMAHGENVEELTVREPTLGALAGIELRIAADGSIDFDLGTLVPIVAALTDIPPSSAKQIALRDLRQFREVIADFLADALVAGRA